MDKLSKQIISYLKSQPSGDLTYGYVDYYDTFGCSKSDFSAAVDYLEREGHISRTYYSNAKHSPLGIKLAHEQRHSSEFTKISIINYLKAQHLAIIALIISTLVTIFK